MYRPQYINWIVREDGVVFEDQQSLNCYMLSYVIDNAVIDDWALHIRRHYIPDSELEEDAVLNNMSVEEYLRQFVIPQKNEPFGPTARSNDISEILFADLFEFVKSLLSLRLMAESISSRSKPNPASGIWICAAEPMHPKPCKAGSVPRD